MNINLILAGLNGLFFICCLFILTCGKTTDDKVVVGVVFSILLLIVSCLISFGMWGVF